MSNSHDRQITSSEPAPPANAVPHGPQQAFVEAWFAAHPWIDNTAFALALALPARQRDAIHMVLQQHYGNAFVQRGFAGTLEDRPAIGARPSTTPKESASALEADRDFAAACGSATQLASDLKRSDDRDYELEMMKNLGQSGELDAVVKTSGGAESTISAILAAEAAGTFDAATVSAHAAEHGGDNWLSIEHASGGRPTKERDDAQAEYDAAKGAYDATNRQLMVELYQLSPSLTNAQQLEYQARYRAKYYKIYHAYDTAAAKLSATVAKYAGPTAASTGALEQAAIDDGQWQQENREAEYVAYQSIVESRNPAGAKAALRWLQRLTDGAVGGIGKFHYDQLQLLHPNGLAAMMTTATQTAAITILQEQVNALGPVKPGGPSLAARWTALNSNLLMPMSAAAQLLGLGDIGGLGNRVAEQLDDKILKDRGEITALYETQEIRRLAELKIVEPLMLRLVGVFVDLYGSIATVAGLATGAYADSLIAFASNGGKQTLEDAAERYQAVCGVAKEVRDPTMLTRLIPLIGLAANSVALAIDYESNGPGAVKAIKVAGDLIALTGSMIEFIPAVGPEVGEVVEAIGLSLSALGDLLQTAINIVSRDNSPTLTQADERVLLATTNINQSAATIKAQTEDPIHDGTNMRALGKALTPNELEELAASHPELFRDTEISAAVVEDNVTLLKKSGAGSQLAALIMRAPKLVTTPLGAKNIASLLHLYSVAELMPLIDSFPELVTATVQASAIAANLDFLRETRVEGVTDLVRRVPLLITRPLAASGMFCIWLYLRASFRTGDTIDLSTMITRLDAWNRAALAVGIDWAAAHAASGSILPHEVVRIFFRDPHMKRGDVAYDHGVWCLCTALFPDERAE